MPTLYFFGEGTLLCYFLENLKKETSKNVSSAFLVISVHALWTSPGSVGTGDKIAVTLSAGQVTCSITWISQTILHVRHVRDWTTVPLFSFHFVLQNKADECEVSPSAEVCLGPID